MKKKLKHKIKFKKKINNINKKKTMTTILSKCDICKENINEKVLVTSYKFNKLCCYHKLCLFEKHQKQKNSDLNKTITVIIVSEYNFPNRSNQFGLVNVSDYKKKIKLYSNDDSYPSILDLKLRIEKYLPVSYPVEKQLLFRLIINENNNGYTIDDKICYNNMQLDDENIIYRFWLVPEKSFQTSNIPKIIFFKYYENSKLIYLTHLAVRNFLEPILSYNLPDIIQNIHHNDIVLYDETKLKWIDKNTSLKEQEVKHGSIIITTSKNQKINLTHFLNSNLIFNALNSFSFTVYNDDEKTKLKLAYNNSIWKISGYLYKNHKKIGIFIKSLENENQKLKGKIYPLMNNKNMELQFSCSEENYQQKFFFDDGILKKNEQVGIYDCNETNKGFFCNLECFKYLNCREHYKFIIKLE